MGIIAGFYLTFRSSQGAFFALVCICLVGRPSGPQNGVSKRFPGKKTEREKGSSLKGGKEAGVEDREAGLSWAVSTEPVSMKTSKIMAFRGCSGLM